MPARCRRRLRRSPILQLSVCADASGPAGDGRDPARAASRPIRSPRACWRSAAAPAATCWRWRRRRPGMRAVGVDLAPGRSPKLSWRSPRSGWQRRVPAGGRPRADDGKLGEFDYVIAHGVYSWIPEEAATRCWRRSGRPRSRTGSRTSPSTRSPAATSGACCATPACGTPATRSAPRRRPRKAQELYRFLKEQRVSDADTYGTLLGREVPALADAPSYRLVHDDLSENWTRLVRGVRRARGRARARLRRGGGPLQPALGDAARGRRAGGVESRGRRPDRVREPHATC